MRTDRRHGLRERFGPRNAEIRHLDLQRRRHEQVGRFEVAVNHRRLQPVQIVHAARRVTER